MALLKPEIQVSTPNTSVQAPAVTVDPQDIYNLGTSVKTLLDSFVKKEEPKADPETKDLIGEPVITPSMSDSGLSTQAQGFLDAIASAEGTGGDYNIIVGGQKFEGVEHPNIVGVVTKAGPSTAAGKYQITKQTWDYLKGKYSDLGDFSPQNQDKAAFYLAKERYRQNTPGGRDLEADLAAGNTQFLREALQKTWTGIVVDKSFEKTVGNNIRSRSTTVLKPVGFTTIKYTNEGAIRNKPVTFELEAKLDMAISTVLGTGYTVEVYSGGQEGDRRTGTERHDVDKEGLGLAADVKIYDPEGKQIKDRKTLDKLKDYWLQNDYGSVGTYMGEAGMHFDIWTKDKLKPGMASTWRY
jgi:muramidase (phage lysozyme)